jgi:hypothetical protein
MDIMIGEYCKVCFHSLERRGVVLTIIMNLTSIVIKRKFGENRHKAGEQNYEYWGVW